MAVFGNVMMVFNRNTDPLIPLDNFISYWKFNGNALDSVGSNNGTPTSITYPTGLIGQAADFNGTTSKVVVPDANDLSFGNGTSDVDFSTITLIKFDDLSNNPRIFNKVKADAPPFEYIALPINGKFNFVNYDTFGNNQIKTENDVVIPLSEWIVITQTYEASTKTLKTYQNTAINNVNLNTGVYNAMINTDAPLVIGEDGRSAFANNLDGQINALSFLNVKLSEEQVAYAVNKYLTANEHLI